MDEPQPSPFRPDQVAFTEDVLAFTMALLMVGGKLPPSIEAEIFNPERQTNGMLDPEKMSPAIRTAISGFAHELGIDAGSDSTARTDFRLVEITFIPWSAFGSPSEEASD